MIELAFVVCLATSPEVCEERALVFVDVSESQCMQGAQPELARWISEHARWRIARWTCRSRQSGRRI